MAVGGCSPSSARGKGVRPKEKAGEPPDLPAAEAKVRAGIKWQKEMADLLNGYLDTIGRAFEELVLIHQQLDEKGFGQVDGAGAVAKGLLTGLREAFVAVSKSVEASRPPVERHLGTLEACLEDVALADGAEADRRHYCEKVEALSQGSASPKELAKLERNRGKLRQAETAAGKAQARAQESLRNMEARRETFCTLASDVVSSTLLALKASTARVSTTSGPEVDAASHVSQPKPAPYSPPTDEPPPRTTAQENPPGVAPAAFPGPNPFSADVGHCRRLDLPPPERLEGACRSDPRATMGPSMAAWTPSQGPRPESVLRPPEADAASGRAKTRCAPRCLQLMPCACLK